MVANRFGLLVLCFSDWFFFPSEVCTKDLCEVIFPFKKRWKREASDFFLNFVRHQIPFTYIPPTGKEYCRKPIAMYVISGHSWRRKQERENSQDKPSLEKWRGSWKVPREKYFRMLKKSVDVERREKDIVRTVALMLITKSSSLEPAEWSEWLTSRRSGWLGAATSRWTPAFPTPPRFSAAGMVRLKNHERSGWVHLICNPGQVLTAGWGETPGRARTFVLDQSKEVSQDRERRRKLHRCIQTAIDSARRDWSSARRDWSSARRDWRLFFQTFQPSFVISWPISTNEPSLESLKSQQSDGIIFVPVSPRERTIAPFLKRVLTLSAQFPRIRTCSGQINLYRGEIAVLSSRSLSLLFL